MVAAAAVLPSASAFGKYLQSLSPSSHGGRSRLGQQNKGDAAQRLEEGLDSAGDLSSSLFGEYYSVDGSSSSSSNSSSSLLGEMEIEVLAAVLIASLFAIFIFIYVCFLQCWWRCSDLQSKKRVSEPTYS